MYIITVSIDRIIRRKEQSDGTVERLAGMMDTDLYGLMGVSTCNDQDCWEYYIAVATTQDKTNWMNLLFRHVPGRYSIRKAP